MALSDEHDEQQNNAGSICTGKEFRLVLEFLKCSQFLQREVNQMLAPFGLKYQQFVVLDEIIWNGPVSQKMICETLLFEKSNISKIVKMFQDRHLVGLTVYPGDRRSTLLSETSQGAGLWKQCVTALSQLSHGYFDMLNDAEIKESIRLMKKIQKGLKQKKGL